MPEARLVVLISADAEWEAVKELLVPAKLLATPVGEYFDTPLPGADRLGEFCFFHGGWGKVSAAATAQYVIDHYHPGLLVNLGTCGGFDGRIQRGAILLVARTIIYDILEQMSDPEEAISHYSTELDLTWLPEPLPHPVLRGLLVSADRDILAGDIPGLVKKYGAVAADWESGAIAWVARKNGVHCLILRGVTDLVGAAGGEAYGNIAIFQANTWAVMQELIRQLPDWLKEIQPGSSASVPLFNKVDCLRLYVSDLESGLAFYRDRLGHALIWRTTVAAGLRLPGSDTEIVIQTEQPGQEIDLTVESTETATQQFANAGGEVVVPPFDIQIGRCSVVRDPWGNQLVLLDTSKGLLVTDKAGNVIGNL